MIPLQSQDWAAGGTGPRESEAVSVTPPQPLPGVGRLSSMGSGQDLGFFPPSHTQILAQDPCLPPLDTP